jgi:hypothetical protein
VLSGANEALVGEEILQYKTATLLSTATYQLSGLLRGRRGTEWAQSVHLRGERFVALPTVSAVAGPQAEVGTIRYFKPVTLGSTLAETSATGFANLGVALRPYAPVQLGGGSNAAGDVTLTAVRRDRKAWAWPDTGEIVNSEAYEAYIVQIWDSTYTLCANARIVSLAATMSYTAAMQATDFGANQQTIYFTVAQVQIGTGMTGSHARGTAAGAGGSNNNPTVPVAPYGWPLAFAAVPTATRTEDRIFAMPYDTVTIGLLVGQVWSAKFTTPSTPVGWVNLSDAASLPVYRHLWVATDSGGRNKVTGSEKYGADITLFVGATTGITLSASTVYYLFVDFRLPNGLLSGLLGADGTTIVDITVT